MSSVRFDGRVVAVTGAARGIGRSIAMRLAAEGARVVVQDLREDEGRAVVAELTASGAEAIFCGGDAGDAATAERIVGDAVASFGRIDHLVNNAARSIRRPLLELTAEDAEATFRATYWSAFHATQCAARRMIEERHGGSIVMVSSGAAKIPIPFAGVYSSAKAALNTLAASFAMELAPHAIRVNVVSPGLVDTPGEREQNGAQLRLIANRIALGRAGQPDDIAGAVAFLLSDDAAYVTGSELAVDGGFHLPSVRRPPRAE